MIGTGVIGVAARVNVELHREAEGKVILRTGLPKLLERADARYLPENECVFEKSGFLDRAGLTFQAKGD